MPTPWPYLLHSKQFTATAGEQYVVYFAPANGYLPKLAVASYASMLGRPRRGEAGADALDTTPPHRIRSEGSQEASSVLTALRQPCLLLPGLTLVCQLRRALVRAIGVVAVIIE